MVIRWNFMCKYTFLMLVIFFVSCSSGTENKLDCKIGDIQRCYSGDDASINVGICKSGSQYCSSEGKWEECLNEVLPSA
jgi:hypothetical protein